MENIYKLNVEDSARIAKSMNLAPKIVQWRSKRIAVRPLLSLSEMMQVVNNVMDACIDRETGYFVPETLDFALRVNVVSMYACVELPEDISLQYTLLYATDLYDTIAANVNKGQLEAIKNAVNVCANGFLRQIDI